MQYPVSFLSSNLGLLNLGFDTDLEGDYNVSINNDDDWQLGLSPGNFKDVEPEVWAWVPTPKVLTEVKIKSERTETGYQIIAILPWSVINLEKAPMSLGVMIDPTDADEIDAPEGTMMSTSKNRIWGDPTTFGVLEFQ